MKKNHTPFRNLIRAYYFPVFAFLGLSVYLLQRFHVALPELVNNYLNDFLCMPIVLKVCLYGVRFIKSEKRIQLPLLLQILLTLLFIIYFEGVLPISHERYTADYLDIIAYTLGLIFFIRVEGYEHKNRNNN